MLNELMLILQRGGAVTLDQIARELDTTPEMIAQLIDYVERLGKLTSIGDCVASCAGCSLAQTCPRSEVPRIWSNSN